MKCEAPYAARANCLISDKKMKSRYSYLGPPTYEGYGEACASFSKTLLFTKILLISANLPILRRT
jgi:hypothetical protein